MHRETYVKHLRQEDVGGSDEENGKNCRHLGETLFNSDRMTLSNVDTEEEPKSPIFGPRSLTMKRAPKAEETSLVPTLSTVLTSSPEWQATSKRVKELPWLRLKRRRTGRG